MKTKISFCLALVLSCGLFGCSTTKLHSDAAKPLSFLVFEISRFNYDTTGHAGGTENKQKFKVPLTEEFVSNFKHTASHNGFGTELCCIGGTFTNGLGGTQFIWWIHKTADGHWSIRMWSSGFETIKEIQISSDNPSVSQYVTVKKLEDIDMSYMRSYVNIPDGLNISFGAKYMSAVDVQAEGYIPTASVKKTDHSNLFKGDVLTNCPITFSCAFQEN